MFTRDPIVEKVQTLNDIVEVISNYVVLKRAGRNMKGLCPFHGEKTPSFMVHPEKQIFHCFGCGAGGDVYSFLMKIENIGFPEALERLAERVHVTLPERKPLAKEQRSESDNLCRLYQTAADWFEKVLLHPDYGKKGREYLSKRGFSKSDYEKFHLGYAMPEWQRLCEHLSKKGFSEKLMIQSGLVGKSQRNNSLYDMFRDRLMFPIFNTQGKAVAVGGRTFGNEQPKYINSPETPVFKKRQELYGLHLAKRGMVQSETEIRTVLVVEGYLDCIRLHASGFDNAVATLGTSLTSDHVRLLKRYADEAVVIFDGDKAGEEAALRGLDIFLQEGMNLKVLAMPRGEDPDSLILKRGAQEMKRLLQEASQDIFDFKFDVLQRKFNRSDSLGLIKISNEFMETFLKIENSVLLDRYMKKLALHLNVQEGALRSEFDKLKGKRHKVQDRRLAAGTEKKVQAETRTEPAQLPPMELMLLALFMTAPGLLNRFKKELPDYVFSTADGRVFLQTLDQVTSGGKTGPLAPGVFMQYIQNDKIKALAARIASEFEFKDQEIQRTFEESIRIIKSAQRQERLRLLRSEIEKAEQANEPDKVAEAVKAYQKFLAEREV